MRYHISGKIFTFATILFAIVPLTGCNSTSPSAPEASVTVVSGTQTDIGIKAFKDVCLASAPSFTTGVARAKKYGITSTLDLGAEKIGETPDKSLTIEINPNHECSITTEKRPGDAVHTQFVALVAAIAKVADVAQVQTPFVATVSGKPFIFQHDRSGGEAYVMLAK